jgi:hypothetical protein
MTEFEWFHWWPFNTLIGLICLTLVVTTLRRIPLRPLNYGVWMIHSGIIVLALGSVIYFSSKVEGDAPVVRRQVRAVLGEEEPVTVVAMPGNSVRLGGSDQPYDLQIASIDPAWEILTGEDAGRRAYSVNVRVQTPQRTFIRQLLAGYPHYTEDIIPSGDPNQPMTRARKVLGKPLVDEDLDLSLEYVPQEWFYLSNDLSKSWALYLREVADDGPAGAWVERPIDGLPLYNDRVADLSDVWVPLSPPLRPDPLHVDVPSIAEDDPLADVPIRVTSYLRYAFMDARRRLGGDLFDPTIRLRLATGEGFSEEYELVAFDATRNMEPHGRMIFEWLESESELEAILAVRAPVLKISVPEASVDLEVPIERLARGDPSVPFTPIDGTDYRYRVDMLHDGLGLPTGEVISVAVVSIKTPDRSFERWVCDDPGRTRDVADVGDAAAAHSEPLELDANLVMEYVPGERPAPITIVAGPDQEQLRLVLALGGDPRVEPISTGVSVALNEEITLTVLQYAVHTEVITQPAVVPREQRNPDARAQLAMIQVELPDENAGVQSHWLHFHDWPIPDPTYGLRRVRYRPVEVDVDGRRFELMFSRQRHRLPAPVVLDDFVMDTHVGGFTGQNVSVLNWTSQVRFQEGGDWGDPLAVSVNSPDEFGGFWYFQAQWDPPDEQMGYRGLNFTVLGVGNRRGVYVQLLGCCIMVLGMIYAFYVKPIIKRRRQQTVYAQVEEDGRTAQRPTEAAVPDLTPVGVAREESG